VLNGGVILIRHGDDADGGLVMCLSTWPSHAIFVDAQHIEHTWYSTCRVCPVHVHACMSLLLKGHSVIEKFSRQKPTVNGHFCGAYSYHMLAKDKYIQ
jgi:hypothetical protein